MLKQSLVQEKISELSLLSGARREDKERPSQQPQSQPAAQTPTSTTNTSLNAHLPHMPHWPRLQIGTCSAQLLRSTRELPSRELAESPPPPPQPPPLPPHLVKMSSIDFDGAETVNTQAASHRTVQLKQAGAAAAVASSWQRSGRRASREPAGSRPPDESDAAPKRSTGGGSGGGGGDGAEFAYDNTLKLKNLEKSIRFIQQQHSETLRALHEEIEKLKSENRGT
jgi:hypothetical protein